MNDLNANTAHEPDQFSGAAIPTASLVLESNSVANAWGIRSGDGIWPWIARIFLLAQFGFAVLLCLLIAITITVDREETAGALIGFVYAQILLSAVLTSLAPIKLIPRLITGTLVTLFFSAAMYRCAWRDGGGHETAFAVVGPMLAQWILFQIPLWIMRFQGWKLAPRGMLTAVNRRAETQFGIKHLMIWTTVIAIFMAVIRFLFSTIDFESGFNGSNVEFAIYLLLGNSIIALPIIWGCLTRSFFWVWMGVSVLVCITVSVAEFLITPAGDLLVFANAFQGVISILLMVSIRISGFRLQRAPAA